MTTSYPTVEGDGARFGVPVSRLNYPAGIGGVHLSLTEMSRRIYEGIRAPSIQQFAEMVIRNWAQVPVSRVITNRDAAQIFLDYVKANVRYRPDPPGTEVTKSAAITLCVPGAQMCIPVEDCDGLVVAFDSLCGAYGIPVRIIKQVFGSSDQEHVLGEIQDDDGTWYPADPSGPPDKPVGWKAQATREDIIDPLDPATIQRVGANEAEFIGIGSRYRGVGALSRYRPRSRAVTRSPRTVSGLVSAGLGACVGMGASASDVQALGVQLDAQYEALNTVITTSCPSMSASDRTAWEGAYTSWKTSYNHWISLINAPWYSIGQEVEAAFTLASTVIAEMQRYASVLADWQQRAKSICTGYAPPPAAAQATPLPSGNTLNDFAKATASVTGLVITGTLAYVIVDALGWLDVFKPPKRA